MKFLPFLFTTLVSNSAYHSNSIKRSFMLRSSKTSFLSSISSPNNNNNINVLVPIAHGSEEIETVTIIDTLVRSGAKVTVASVEDDLLITCSRGVLLQANCFISDCSNLEYDWDCIALPGGMPGAETLKNNEILKNMVLKQHNKSKYIGAICAAPAVVLSSWKVIDKNCQATGYPAPQFIEKIDNYLDNDVIVSDNIVTSRGPGTALKFSLKLVELLFGEEISMKLKNEMLAN